MRRGDLWRGSWRGRGGRLVEGRILCRVLVCVRDGGGGFL